MANIRTIYIQKKVFEYFDWKVSACVPGEDIVFTATRLIDISNFLGITVTQLYEFIIEYCGQNSINLEIGEICQVL